MKDSKNSERACSLVVTRALVAPEVLGSTPNAQSSKMLIRIGFAYVYSLRCEYACVVSV